MNARLGRCAAACAFALAVTSCGGTSDGHNVSAAALSELRADVLALTRAAAARDAAAASSALDDLTTDLAAARAAGTIDEARATQIREAADAVRLDLATGLTSPSTTTAPTTRAPEPTKTKHHGNGEGNGKPK